MQILFVILLALAFITFFNLKKKGKGYNPLGPTPFSPPATANSTVEDQLTKMFTTAQSLQPNQSLTLDRASGFKRRVTKRYVKHGTNEVIDRQLPKAM